MGDGNFRHQPENVEVDCGISDFFCCMPVAMIFCSLPVQGVGRELATLQ